MVVRSWCLKLTVFSKRVAGGRPPSPSHVVPGGGWAVLESDQATLNKIENISALRGQRRRLSRQLTWSRMSTMKI